jgi:hypothetical protein
MKKIIVAASMVCILLTTTAANAQKVLKDKKVIKAEMQRSNTAVAGKQTKMEADTKKVEMKTAGKGTRTRTTPKSRIVETTTRAEAKPLLKKQ